jgi:hypothetical protein
MAQEKIKDAGVQDGRVKFGIHKNIKILCEISKLED